MTAAAQAGKRKLRLAVLVWPAIIVLVGLGTWQVERLEWKTELIASIEARMAAPPVALSGEIDAASPDRFEFTNIRLSGRFRHDLEMIVLARTRGGEAGMRVVTPFVMDSGDAVLVDRGWIPVALHEAARRADGQVVGDVSVEGLLRAAPRRRWFTPENRPEHGEWYWIDPAAMAVEAGIEPRRFYIEAGPKANPGGFPIGGRSVADVPNNHLQYAITWYGLAAALLVIYLLYRRAEARAR